MSFRRPLLDRLLAPIVPRADPSFAPPPTPIADGLWGLDRRLRFAGGARLPSRSLLVRLASGGVVVISPPALLTDETVRAIGAMGPVTHVVVPNAYHYTFLGETTARHPDATLLAAPRAAKRVPALAPADELGSEPPAAWGGELEVAVVGPPDGATEAVLFHVPSRTLVLTDLAFHLPATAPRFDRITWRMAGIPTGFGPGRTSRRLLLEPREAVRPALERIRAWPFDRIVVAHGDVIEREARTRFDAAFARYLRP